MEDRAAGPLFNLDSPFNDPVRQTLFSMVRRPLAKVLRLDTLNSLYADLHRRGGDGAFVDKALDLLGVRFSVDGQPVSRVPKTGPLVAVCNHPFGVLEGLLLVRILREVRPDIKIMANFMLGMIPEMDDLIIQVDPFGGADSSRKNISGLKACMRWLKQGGMLVVFPAGEVSSLKVKKRRVGDPSWSPMIGRIIRKTGAAALPVFFDGRNSGLFQTLGLIHPRLRTVLLPHENLRHATREVIGVRLGTVIGQDKLAELGDDRDVVDYLRFRTYLLRRDRKPRFGFKPREAKRRMDPIANSRGKHILASEVASLPDGNILVDSGDFLVFHADAFMIPGCCARDRHPARGDLPPGGRRYGTGHGHRRIRRHLPSSGALEPQGARGGRGVPLRPDRRDPGRQGTVRPVHLHPVRLPRGVPGGAGTGARDGPLVHRPQVPAQLPAAALPLEGAGRVRGPQSEIHPALRLRVHFQRVFHGRPRADRRVHGAPLLPAGDGGYGPAQAAAQGEAAEQGGLLLPEAAFRDPEDVADFVRDVEDGRSIPVLLKQYLKLGGKIIGFNMDPDFGNCMDGLILVDLLKSDPKVLSRFMGTRGVERFLAANRRERAEPVRIGPVAA